MCIVEHGPWKPWWPCRWGEVSHKIFSGHLWNFICVSWRGNLIYLTAKFRAEATRGQQTFIRYAFGANWHNKVDQKTGTHDFVWPSQCRLESGQAATEAVGSWTITKDSGNIYMRECHPRIYQFFGSNTAWWMFSYTQSSNQNLINSCRFFPTSVTRFTILQCQVAWVASLTARLHRKMYSQAGIQSLWMIMEMSALTACGSCKYPCCAYERRKRCFSAERKWT